METISSTITIKDLKQIQARLAALIRGMQTHPENAADDYSEATISSTSTIKDLKQIQARLAALIRGMQTHPENAAADYSEAMNVLLLLLNHVIERLELEEAAELLYQVIEPLESEEVAELTNIQ
jgi:hypothetical protein